MCLCVFCFLFCFFSWVFVRAYKAWNLGSFAKIREPPIHFWLSNMVTGVERSSASQIGQSKGRCHRSIRGTHLFFFLRFLGIFSLLSICAYLCTNRPCPYLVWRRTIANSKLELSVSLHQCMCFFCVQRCECACVNVWLSYCRIDCYTWPFFSKKTTALTRYGTSDLSFLLWRLSLLMYSSL